MRIGMMVDVYKPHVRGITNYVSLNKRYIEQAGHEVKEEVADDRGEHQAEQGDTYALSERAA